MHPDLKTRSVRLPGGLDLPDAPARIGYLAFMPDKNRPLPQPGANEKEALDSVNAALRARRDSSQALRHSMEADIEQRAKKRRREALDSRRKR